jgi:MscS family membrane protein
MNPSSNSFESALPQFLITMLFWLVVAGAVYLALTYVVRAVTRRLPGELDDRLLSIARKPILVLCVLFGLTRGFAVLPLPFDIGIWIGRLLFTALIVILARLAHRIMADVVIRHAQQRAQRTETRLDDVLVAIARLISPVIIFFVAALVVLTHWGVDVGAALAGAGIAGLVLGLALQETFNNIFAGISILADEPFTPGELIMLPDGASGKVCRVEHIGLRTTKLYHVNDHTMIYVPNKDLASAAITNIFKPSYDMRTTLNVGVAYATNLNVVVPILKDALCEHPNVLVSDIPQHMEKITAAIARQRRSMEAMPASAQQGVMARLARWEAALPKLHTEHILNQALIQLDQSLERLMMRLVEAERGGFKTAELETLRAHPAADVDARVTAVTESMDAWAALDDPWALPEELATERTRWRKANQRLMGKWASLRQAIDKPTLENEQHLDTATAALRHWLSTNYKALPESWKDPRVDVAGFGSSSVDLRVYYFVDDVRLEHFERQRRVNAELMIDVHERFKAHGIEIPFPQMDVWMRKG